MHKAILNSILEDILDYHSIGVGDYYYIPAGKVHAICKNTTLLEVSQSSDITYRLYDYNRLDNGKLRTLHIVNSFDVISFPDTKIKNVHDDKHFSFNIIDVKDENIKAHVIGDYFYVIEGNGIVDDEKISKGDFIAVTSNCDYIIHGNMKIAFVRITS